MDPFAQSRADDDLFADEFEPISEPTTTIDSTDERGTRPAETVLDRGKPAPSSGGQSATIPAAAPSKQPERRGQQERRPRGGRGGSIQNGLSQSRYATQAESSPALITSTQEPPKISTLPTTISSIEKPSTTQPTTNQNNAPIPESTGRTPAVRGDRSATGGPAHKKLTEEELTAKLEKMAVINAQKAERHRLSEADQAAFQHREKELAKERREKAVAEKKNERVMEMERAKNRERKMRAQGGREWDSEKTEADIVDRKGRSSEYVRGGHGGVVRGGLAGSRYSMAGEGEDENTTSSPRRGGGFEIRGRGGRGGRGGGRGAKAQALSVPAPEDFPPLSSAPIVTPAASGDWAEEMATPIEEKKTNVSV